MVLDLLARRLGLEFTRLERHAEDGSRIFSGKVKAKVCEGRRKGRSFLLVKPQTYVNLSGEVVSPLLRHAGGQPLLFVIVDDLNLPLGRIRIRPSGSAGGHNGLKSIQQMLGSDAYPRLRLGIGQTAPQPEQGTPSHGKPSPAKDGSEGLRSADWPDYVLAPFLPEEREVLGRVLGRAADCVEAWLDGKDLQTLMGTYNSPESGSRPGE
jgi:aminoacyl-tRNA hydrolase